MSLVCAVLTPQEIVCPHNFDATKRSVDWVASTPQICFFCTIFTPPEKFCLHKFASAKQHCFPHKFYSTKEWCLHILDSTKNDCLQSSNYTKSCFCLHTLDSTKSRSAQLWLYKKIICTVLTPPTKYLHNFDSTFCCLRRSDSKQTVVCTALTLQIMFVCAGLTP